MKQLILTFFAITAVSYGQTTADTTTVLTKKNSKPKRCWFKNPKPIYSVVLSDSVAETSSLIHFEKLLWTANDDTDPTLYGMNEKGIIQKKITIAGLKNKEWEEITQDNNYLYLGDFGNNYSGNRRDLRILRLEKKALQMATPKIDTISFSYADQIDFEGEKPNKTNFDCEAFIAFKDSLYLFTKQYKDCKTTLYVLPKSPGNYVAKKLKTYNINGLVTGATYNEANNRIALTGYSKLLKPFIFIMDNFEGTDFFGGNKQKIKLKLRFRQIEGISTSDGLHYFLTNEKLNKKPFFKYPQQLHCVDLSGLY